MSDYGEGLAGSKVRVRARIEKGDGKTVVIREIPYGTNTTNLIESIVAAGEKGKIKVAHIEDNTARRRRDPRHLPAGRGRGTRPWTRSTPSRSARSATSPNGMVILYGKPRPMSVTDMVAHGANETRTLLKRDLEYKLEQLELKWHHKSLVQIFVENRIYLKIEKCKTWDAVLLAIDRGLGPFKEGLRREVVEDDLVMLTEVKMRRISAWDAERAREELLLIEEEIAAVKGHLKNLTGFTIDWFEHLKETYGKGRERKTELTTFDTIKAVTVVERTAKLYVDRGGGFVGSGLKNAEEVGPCSSIDDVIAFREDGCMRVVRMDEKVYVGEKILHVQIFKPEDRKKVFSLLYEDQISGKAWVKRFTVGGITREKDYNLCPNAKRPRVYHFSDADEIYLFVKLKKRPRIRTELMVNVTDQLVKGRGAGGNLVTKYRISSVRPISKAVYEKK